MLSTTEISIERRISQNDLARALESALKTGVTFQVEQFTFSDDEPAILADVVHWDQGWATVVTLHWTIDASERDIASALSVRLGSRIAIGASGPAPDHAPCFLVYRPDGRIDRGAEAGFAWLDLEITEEGVRAEDYE